MSSLACSLKTFAKPQPVSPHSCRKRNHLVTAKDWWKVCFQQNNNISKFSNGITIYHDTNNAATTKSNYSTVMSTDSVIDSNSQNSTNQINHESGKLFPRNMPSIRRSRRKNMLTKTMATNNNNNENMPLSILNKNNDKDISNKTKICDKVTKSTPKKLRVNSDKNHNLTLQKPKALKLELSPQKKELNYASKSLMITKNSKELLVNMKLAVLSHDISLDNTQDTKETHTKSPNSQLSSLISYDLSCSPYQENYSATTKISTSKFLTVDETFHSSGISCNDETPSEASCNSMQKLNLNRSHMSLETEEALIEAEVAQLTNNLTCDQKMLGSKCCAVLPVNELKSLNTCRNRNALWLHSMSQPSSWPVNKKSPNHNDVDNDDDDLQLSDLEEQLALVHGQQKTSISRTATYKK